MFKAGRRRKDADLMKNNGNRFFVFCLNFLTNCFIKTVLIELSDNVNHFLSFFFMFQNNVFHIFASFPCLQNRIAS